MAFLIADRVMETTTTTGTGTVTLAGAVTGYQSFASIGNANTCTYCIYAVDANGIPTGAWETGIGTYTSSGTTLSRGVIESSNANALVNFAAGTKRVIVCNVAKYSPLAMTTTANRAIQVADQTALSSPSGNARGKGAVDLQIQRLSASQVASGAYSILLGGKANKASGVAAIAGGGQYCTASGDYAVAIGGSLYTNATAICSTSIGGRNNTASAAYATVVGGNCGLANKYGQFSRASGKFTANGDAQCSIIVARKQTTNGSASTLFLDGASAKITLPDNTTWTVFGLITCRRADADGTNSHWYFYAGIKRDANAASTAMTVACTPVLIGQDAGAAGTVLTVDADTTNGALRINVTGEPSKTYNWVGTLYITESAG